MLMADGEGAFLAVAESVSAYAGLSQPEWMEVLVDCPGSQGLFTYRLPAGVMVRPGDIVSVPFGAQQVGAIAIQFVDALPTHLDPNQIREIEAVVSSGFFPTSYWQLLNRMACYYQAPLLQAIRVALPPGLLARSQRRLRLVQSEELSSLDDPWLNLPARQILEILQTQKKHDCAWRYLQQQVRGANRGLRPLLQRGWVESYLQPPKLARPKRRQAASLTAAAAKADQDLTPRQREILEVLKRQGGDLWCSDLLKLCRTSPSTLKTLERKGYLTLEQREVLRLESSSPPATDSPKSLTGAQAHVLDAIAQLSGYTEALLHGVTGSGKTEVYLQAIAPRLQAGCSALVLVPEIGLTPQLTDRFRARFGDKVCVYHSALSDGERYDTWRQLLDGTPRVIIGTRSAVFAPLPNLGLIVLDEEHDSSFKQDQPAPCYHARTLAQWRAELDNCPLLLGSATPSLESWVKARSNPPASPSIHPPAHPTTSQSTLPPTHPSNDSSTSKPSPLPSPPSPSIYLSLPERVRSQPLPPIQVVDMRQEFQQGNRSLFSRPLQAALKHMHAQRQQGLLFINRRGHSTFVSCRSCGHVLECPHCDVSLTYHYTREAAQPLLRCHYCNHWQAHPPQCPVCASPYLKHFGSGTQRVVEELSRRFPQLRVIRFDSDTTRTKGAHRRLLTQFAQGEADLLVGTQMIAKGIDLPQVTLVGVVAADGLLYLSDYRASERALQTLTQVAGRAGRGEEPGQVILQTYTPDHPAIQAVKAHEYESFMETELQQRAGLNYPPIGRLILLRLSSVDAVAVRETAEQLAAELRQESGTFELLGPAPASILRVARRYRWQLLLKFPPNAPAELPNLTRLHDLRPATVSLTIDVDPLNLA